MKKVVRYLRKFTNSKVQRMYEKTKGEIQDVFVQRLPNPMELHIPVIKDWGGLGEGFWHVWS